MDGTEYCSVESCYFDAVGGNGVFLNDYNYRSRVAGSKFTETGESAVCLVGTRAATLGSAIALPVESVVTNNLIHDCGVFGKQIAGVFCAVTMRTTVSRNVIYNVPRSGITINDGYAGGHVVEFNDVYNTVQETHDHGPFNSWGRERYWCQTQSHDNKHTSPHKAGNVKLDAAETTIIRNNYFHGIDEYVGSDYRQAIDLDDGTSNYHVYKHLCIGIAIGVREGDFRTVENNVIVTPVVPCGFHVGYDSNSDVFRRNIIVTSSDVLVLNWPPPTSPWLGSDFNLFHNARSTWLYRPRITVGSRDGTTRTYTLAEWQDLGYDEHSIVADPMFVDAEHGDYRVGPKSPALSLGFINFDMDKFGLTAEFPDKWRD